MEDKKSRFNGTEGDGGGGGGSGCQFQSTDAFYMHQTWSKQQLKS